MNALDQRIARDLAIAYANWDYWNFHAPLGTRRDQTLRWAAEQLLNVQIESGVTLVYADQLIADAHLDRDQSKNIEFESA